MISPIGKVNLVNDCLRVRPTGSKPAKLDWLLTLAPRPVVAGERGVTPAQLVRSFRTHSAQNPSASFLQRLSLTKPARRRAPPSSPAWHLLCPRPRARNWPWRVVSDSP